MADILLQKKPQTSQLNIDFTDINLKVVPIKQLQTPSKLRITKQTIIALIAGIFAFWAICGSGEKIVFFGSMLIFSSFPVYVWIKWNLKDD
jgi:hypothetical protein